GGVTSGSLSGLLGSCRLLAGSSVFWALSTAAHRTTAITKTQLRRRVTAFILTLTASTRAGRKRNAIHRPGCNKGSIISPHYSPNAPGVASARWFPAGFSSSEIAERTGPALGSSAPYTRRLIPACTRAPAHMAHGSIVQ